ncbi:exonuclease 1 isoform X1 [Athene cunicularia]|uniref:exonuclease 1 isoform X1 n=1 Tax=Athene cunicularia TaxID=194338 RepID=UPI000EF74F2E|nr:exonuclease 1 isoform X1 [Athene cunicularia]XP_026700667.1 exonuclease 1 isoform X1 [Athene cunicularia]
MGIQGLLQFIKEAAEPTHVKKYKGQTVAVDAYCWLHKGAYACAEKLARGEPTDVYVVFCMKLVDMLLSSGIKPILVFDGCTLPSKKEVEKARREKRQASLLKGKQLLQEGRLSEARECFGRSVNVTHVMAHEVIKAARARGVDCIVAPYEADAQLAYLNKIGMVQAIITEDSDLLAFGCKKVFLKIDKFGNGLEIDQARLGNCKQLGNVFTEEKFRYMCILSGCDYLSSIHGIGLAKACKLLKLANNPDIIKVIKKMGQYLKMNITVSEEYIQGFTRANNTFLYQLVFDPVHRKLVPLNAYGDDIDPETLIYAGRHFGDGTAFQIAIGNVDIDTMEQIDNYNPDTAQPMQQRSCGWNDRPANHVNSIWSRDYKLGPNADTVPQKMSLLEKSTTKGMEKIISVKGLKLSGKELLSKRPRNVMLKLSLDVEEISDGDLLNQYSFSKAKKFRKEDDHGGQAQKSISAIQSRDSSGNSVTQESSNSLPRVRNRFASFLQRKNKEKDSVIVPGTKSRFFCNDAIMFGDRVKEDDSDVTRDAEQDCQKQEVKHVAGDVSQFSETEKSRTIFTPPGEKQKNCFQWFSSLANNSGNPGPSHTVFSQQFHQQRSNCMVSQENEINGVQTVSGAVCGELEEESSLLTQLERSSQTQRSSESLESSPESSEMLQVSNNGSDAEESDSSSKLADDQCTRSPVFSALQTDKKNTIIKTKVPGLHKSSCIGSRIVTKLKPLIPAKASGLSKKLSPVQKRNHCDAENKLGLQATISELRKNFQFKREYEKLPSCKKSDPLSPIKENIQLTPETEEEIFNHLEKRSHVQRAIFQ